MNKQFEKSFPYFKWNYKSEIYINIVNYKIRGLSLTEKNNISKVTIGEDANESSILLNNYENITCDSTNLSTKIK